MNQFNSKFGILAVYSDPKPVYTEADLQGPDEDTEQSENKEDVE